MLLLILLLPLISAILSLGFGRFIGKYGSFIFSVLTLTLSCFINSCFLYSSIVTNKNYFCFFGNWFDFLGVFFVKWEFHFDTLSLIMISMVTFISLLVHIYSWSYMEKDPFLIRFLGLLSLFTFFMLILLSSSNLIQLFLGWEGIGVCSYFLIGFWYTRIQANKAALKAMIVNRVGDIALLLGLSFCVYFFKSTDFNIIFSLVPLYSNTSIFLCNYDFNSIEIICFFLLLAAVGKSAQIGLHTWLPDAMEGPTPVSALIHAATMVTAGIFLIVRCSFIFEYAPSSLLLITLLGSLTAFFAATSGLVQNDIKKVIAYSTCSQLGYMFYACGLSNYMGSIFHLINHAFFKALLFLSAGSVIHALNNEQDMRKMGSLSSVIPVTYISLIIGSLALTGFPFLDGFFSKDFILEFGLSLIFYSPIYGFSFFLVLLTAIITFIYSIRLVYLVFWNQSNTSKVTFSQIHESSWVVLLPLIFLSFGSIFFGYLTRDWFVGAGTLLWNTSILHLPYFLTFLDVENLLNFKLFLIFIIFGSGLLSLIFVYTISSFYSLNIYFYRSHIFNFLSYKWYFDYILNSCFEYCFNISYLLWKSLDKGILELLQPIFLSNIFKDVHIFFYWKNSLISVFYAYIVVFYFILFFIFSWYI